MSIKIKYGLHKETGIIKHISEVESGEKSGCYCIECGGKLIARKGKIQRHHFQHKTSTKCLGGNPETVLHQIGKKIIKENSRILLSFETYFDYLEVELEKSINDYKPDAVVKNKEDNWLIEIAVTHFLDEVKINKIKRDNNNCIEIRLEKDLIYEKPEIIKNEILNNPNNRIVINDANNIISKQTNSRLTYPKKNIKWTPYIIIAGAIIFRKPIFNFIKKIFK